MKLLAIDTALEDCSVAVATPEGVRAAERTVGRGHAELLMPQIAALLDAAGLGVAGLDRIVVSTGPGSFTGLRVGLAAARGLGLAAAIPVIGVPTLMIHAAQAVEERQRRGGAPRPVLVMIQARAAEFFAQLFAADGAPDGALTVASADALAQAARAAGADVAGAGGKALGPDFVPLHLRSAPSIATLAALGARLSPEAFPPVPVYGKPPDAAPARDGIARL